MTMMLQHCRRRFVSSSIYSQSWHRNSSTLAACSSFDRVPMASPRCLASPLPTRSWSAVQEATHHAVPGLQRYFSSSVEQDSSDTASSVPFTLSRRKGVRNVAVIAHVDHGKTTLVDKLLVAARQSSGSDSSALNRLMDSGELEIERGITITSKVTRLDYHATSGQQITINCVDTPGHADFCGEVDRILSMVDGVALVVDAAEGPMTQTKYVLSRALALGLKPIVVLNKCDRADAATKIESGETESKVQSLFDALGANEEQMDFVTVYASAREGWVTTDPFEALEWGEASGGTNEPNMSDLLDCILEHIPEPFVRSYVDIENPEEAKEGTAFADDKFSLAAVTVGYDQYLGRTCTGRIFSGSVSITDEVTFIKRDKEAPQGSVMPGTVAGIFVFEGISRTPYEGTAYAGDIVTLAGVPDSIAVGDTLTGRKNPVDQPIETPPLVPPTLSMEFGSNNGPLAGLEGTNIASSKIRDRLFAETDNNVTLTIEKSAADSEKTTVFARGELQLGILVEQMRREGFEIIISPPRILTKICPDTGKELEPFEEVTVDVDSEYSGAVVSALTGDRKGVLLEMSESSGDGKSRLVFEAPSRSLLGFNSEIATATKGSAVVTHIYIEDREHAGNLGTGLAKGKLVSNDNGKASAYALSSIAARGELFIEPGDAVYNGMVIGENAKMGDMEVNPIRAKEKTNMRTQAKDETIRLPPPKRRNVEELIGYMSSDEIIEVTPKSVRLRKEILDSSARERAARSKNKAMKALKGK